MMRRALIVLLGMLVFAALPSQAEARGNHSRHGHGYHRGPGGHAYQGGHRYHHGAHFSYWLAPLSGAPLRVPPPPAGTPPPPPPGAASL